MYQVITNQANTMNEQPTYSAIVRQNLDHMGTPAHEWAALVPTGSAKTTDDKGATVIMPEFVFPRDYKEPDSLFSGTQDACLLCGHKIRNVFWIVNHAQKYILSVGSECVTHFGVGDSGVTISKQADKDARRARYDALCKCAELVYHNFSKTVRDSYGRSWQDWNHREAKSIYETLADSIWKSIKDRGFEPPTDRQLANWEKRSDMQALAGLLQRGNEILNIGAK